MTHRLGSRTQDEKLCDFVAGQISADTALSVWAFKWSLSFTLIYPAVILGEGEGAQTQGDPKGQKGTGSVVQQWKQA